MEEYIAYYLPDWTHQFLWTIITGFVVCFLLGFGMGANDCANSYGTVVGAGVLTLYQAYMLATVFETLGAALLGYKVTDTIKDGIVDLAIYDEYYYINETTGNWTIETTMNCTQLNITYGNEVGNCSYSTNAVVLMGELGALSGTAFWLLSASFFKMPVSATQSVVGATLGFTLVLMGGTGVHWIMVAEIVASWVTSPLIAGFVSTVFYFIIKICVFDRQKQLDAAIIFLPFAFFFTFFVNLFAVFFHGSKYLHLDEFGWWQAGSLSLAISGAIAIFVWLWGASMIRKHAIELVVRDHLQKEADTYKRHGKKRAELDLEHQYDQSIASGTDFYTPYADDQPPPPYSRPPTESFSGTWATSVDRISVPVPPADDSCLPRFFQQKHVEDEVVIKVFSLLQIVSGTFLAFSHGSNDTANAIGPLVALWSTYYNGQADSDDGQGGAEMAILMYGVFAMLIGLWILGHKVIATVGKDLTDINAPSGFAMTIGTAFTVLFCSKVGIPISTTHCMVGAVLFVGMARHGNTKAVSLSLFKGIVFAWLVTFPVAMAVSGAVTAALAQFCLNYYS